MKPSYIVTRLVTWLLIGVLVLGLFGCAGSPEEMAAEAQAQKDVQASELQIYQQFSGKTQIVPLLNSDREAANNWLSQKSVTLGSGVITEDMTVVLPQGLDDTSLLIPTIQFSTQQWQSLYQGISNAPAGIEMSWVELFHWTNHLENPLALQANAAFFNQIVQGGMNGAGQVYRLSGAAGNQYMFLTRIQDAAGNARPWVVFLAENGAPITGFQSGMRHDVFTEKEAARYLAKMLERGYSPVNASDLPQAIKGNWGNTGNPPMWRIWWWALSYQAQMYAKMAGVSITQGITTLLSFAAGITDVFFIILPTDLCLPGVCKPEIIT